MNTLPVCLSVIFTGFSVRRSGAVIFCCLQSKRCMHAGRAAPNGANFPKGKFQKAFLPYFLYFTKSRKKFPKGTSLATCRQRSREAAKDLILPQRSRSCGELNRGLENLDVPGKGNGFILFACTKRTGSTPEVCEPLDSGDDSNLRSIHDFCGSDRPSSCNQPRRVFQPFRVSPVRI